MKEENIDLRCCFVCAQNPIRRICLNEECIKQGVFLFCDACRKNQKIRKYASQIHEIDSFSSPFSIFSINSTKQTQQIQILEIVKSLRQSLIENLFKIQQNLHEIDEKIIQNIAVQLVQTFSSENAQRMEEYFKNPPSKQNDELQRRVNTLKCFKQNTTVIENPQILSQKLSYFYKNFNQRLSQLSAKIQNQIKDFSSEFTLEKFFTEIKKPQKTIPKHKENITKSKSIKTNKLQEKKIESKQSQKNSQMVLQPEKNEKIVSQEIQFIKPQIFMEQQIHYQQPQIQKQKQSINQKSSSQKPQITNPDQILEKPAQKQEIPRQIHKKKSTKTLLATIIAKIRKQKLKKQVQKSDNSVQKKVPIIVLQKLPTKSDYSQDEILSINIKNTAQIMKILTNQIIQKQVSSVTIKQEHLDEKQKKERDSSHLKINPAIQKIYLQNIKFLQVVDVKESQRSLLDFQLKIQQMVNLEQMHIFTSSIFLSQEQIISLLFSCQNLKVITFNCFNPASLILQRYKNIMGNHKNQKIQIFAIQQNIGFCQNIQINDLKNYYPLSAKIKKIYDQIFAKSYEQLIKKELEECGQKLNKKETLPHTKSCWFFSKDSALLQKQRIQNMLTHEQNLIMHQCFPSLRNCWIPELSEKHLKQIQQNKKLQIIQHLTLGYHQIKLQAIPFEFYSGKDSFSKSLKNLKSLNLVNLNIYDLFMKPFFSKQCKQLISLKIQFCTGLKNDFYCNLPKYCPKLRKISVNNLTSQIDGDFIFNLKQLETIIIPWSQFQYKGLSSSAEFSSNQSSQIQKYINAIEQENLIEKIHYKKWKYINIYGCTWFHPDFFALIDLKSIEHLNLGKCSQVNLSQLVNYLKICENLESLCLDESPIENQQLFEIISHLPKLRRLSVAHCSRLDFSAGKLSSRQVQMLDQMTNLDLRNEHTPIDSSYTIMMKNPKYLLISRGFDVEQSELLILNQRNIHASSSRF